MISASAQLSGKTCNESRSWGEELDVCA